MPRERYRNFAFTDQKCKDLTEVYENKKDIIRYLCYGLEIAPTTGKLHHQGWVQFFNPKSLKTAQKILELPKRHFKKCYANEYVNDNYCKKDNKFISFGTFKSQGTRSDLEDIKNIIDNNGTIKEVADAHFGDYIRYHSGIQKYKQLVDQEKSKEFRKVEVTLILGGTGQGKTRLAMENCQFKIEGDSLDWWDGYNGENAICIDEYANNIPITKLLNILDGYQLRLPIKGGFTYAKWHKVYITTNLTIDELHANAKSEHKAALMRRITHIQNWHEVSEGNTSSLLTPGERLAEMLSRLTH